MARSVLEGLRGKELLDLGAKKRLLCLCKEVDRDAFFIVLLLRMTNQHKPNGLKQHEQTYLPVPEIRSTERVSLGKEQNVRRDMFLLETRTHFLDLSNF